MTQKMSLQKGLVGHWTMDSRDVDSVVRNRAATSYHAEIRGTPTFGNNSPLNGSVELTEADGDYLPIRNNFYDTNTALPELSISAWIKTSANNQYVMQYDRSEFFRATTGVFASHSSIDGSTSDMSYSGSQDGNWHHLVFWYDSDSSGNKKRMYIDGNVVQSLSDPHNGEALGSTTTTYGSIGAFGESRSFDGSEDARFTGQISDVRLYERALSESEINQLYQMRSLKNNTVGNFHEYFSSGNLNNFDTVNHGSIVQDRVYRGDNAVYCNNNGGEQFSTSPFGTPTKPKYISYRNNEVSGSTGSGLRVKNSNGNYEMGCALDNPEWDIQDGNGFDVTVDQGVYNEWTEFTVFFDWEANTFDIRIIGPNSNKEYFDQNRPLKNGTDMERIEFWEYNAQTWGGSSINAWFDDIQVVR